MLSRLFTQLTAASTWECVAQIPLKFRTFHPQGMVKIGDRYYLSSVKIDVPPEKWPAARGRYDRSPGAGQAYLFQFNQAGELQAEMTCGEGTCYHPGGIDFDGTFLWMPVAEYRPHSRSIVYRVRPETLKAEEVFRFDDHLGGLAYNRCRDALYGISWGSRAFYVWPDIHRPESYVKKLNGCHYIDYQDCMFLEDCYMLCSGLQTLPVPNVGPVGIGGLELVNLDLLLAAHQIPVPLYSPSLRPMTNNPCYVEQHDNGLRFFFIPDDDESTLYIYHVS